MSKRNSAPVASYMSCNPDAVHKSSVELGWNGLTVNLDYFVPFARETMQYAEHHICVNMGDKPARLDYFWDDGFRLRKFGNRISPGQFLVTPAEHGVRWNLREDATALSIRLDAPLVRKIAESAMGMDPKRVEFTHAIGVGDRFVLETAKNLRNWLIGADNRGARFCAELTAELLAVHLLKNFAVRPPKEKIAGELHSRWIVRTVMCNVRDEIAKDWAQDRNPELTLRFYAQKLKTNSPQLSRWFQESEGTSFSEFVEAERVKRAKKLLVEHPDSTVGDVSSTLGFKTESHFCTYFRRITGMTPTEFREATCNKMK